MPSEPTPTGAWFVNQEYNLHAPGCAPLPAAEVKHRDGHFFTLTGEAAAIADDVVRLLNALVGGAAPSAPTTESEPFICRKHVERFVHGCEDCRRARHRKTPYDHDRPSAPTTDAPTDALAAIRARHERDERLTRWVRPDEMHADRAALLAEVERLAAAPKAFVEALASELEGRDEWKRLDSEHRPDHWLAKGLRFALDVARDLASGDLESLRGGATAPTPDPTDDLRDAVRDLLTGLAHPEHLIGCGTVYQTTIPAHVVDRLRRWLGGDTGASHE
jgi:hypothetical protein